MPQSIDKEIDAIKTILGALEALGGDARTSVLEYVIKRLQVSLPAQTPGVAPTAGSALGDMIGPSTAASEQEDRPAHIKDLKEKRKPRSANEMAALVAYYLSEQAPASERKKAVTAKDIETYFKIAGFPLPEHVQMTLPNAKAAGYFDAVGDGGYRLNAVGHNLVVHSMPRGSSSDPSKKRSKKARSSTKKR